MMLFFIVVNRTVRGDIFLNGTLNLGDLFVGFIDDDTIDLVCIHMCPGLQKSTMSTDIYQYLLFERR